MKSDDWLKEFEEFQRSDEMRPNPQLSESILSSVHQALYPPIWKVGLKMTSIHAVIGTLSLLICPQFGVSILPGHGLMYIFMHFGRTGCMFACGGLFLGLSALAAGIWLRPEEIRVIRRSRLWLFSLLGTLSLLTLMIFGASVVPHLALAWLIGAIALGLASLELGWQIQNRWYAFS